MAQIAVAYVVLNRKKSGRWGDNIKAVSSGQTGGASGPVRPVQPIFRRGG
jgi:hypothetical protein